MKMAIALNLPESLFTQLFVVQHNTFCIDVLQCLFEMTAFRSHTRTKTSTPFFDCVVDHALVHALAFPFFNDT